MNKVIVGLIAVFILAAGGAALVLNKGDDKSSSVATTKSAETKPAETKQTDTKAAETAKTITAETVAQHKTKDDCWTIVGGKVYDITQYVPQHPGGDEILRACGVDGTSLFTQRTTSDGQKVGSGTPHDSSATRMLESMQVGTLSN